MTELPPPREDNEETVAEPEIPQDQLPTGSDHRPITWCSMCEALYNWEYFPRCPVCKGDNHERNLTTLYLAHVKPLRGFVRGRARNWNLSDSLVDAEGVVNDVFIALLEYLDRHPRTPIKKPAAWLFVVARRTVGKAVTQARLIADGDPMSHVANGIPLSWSSVAPSPSAADRRNTRATLDAIAELPTNQKIAVYLSKVEGWTLEEIAEFLGCTTNTAGVHVHRGQTRVQETLENELEFAPRPAVRHHLAGTRDFMQIRSGASSGAHMTGSDGRWTRRGRGVVWYTLFAGVVNAATWLMVILVVWLNTPDWLALLVAISVTSAALLAEALARRAVLKWCRAYNERRRWLAKLALLDVEQLTELPCYHRVVLKLRIHVRAAQIAYLLR